MCVGQPGVYRPHRYFYGKGKQECDENILLCGQTEWSVRKSEQVEPAGQDIKVDKTHQHQDRAEECVEEELKRCVDALLATPDADDEEHRDQHSFPEQVKQQRIESGKHADHESFEDQECGEVLRWTTLDLPLCPNKSNPPVRT